jgi:hypothetical protein
VPFLRLVLFAATLCFAGAQYCSPGSSTACDHVLVVHEYAIDPSGASRVQTALRNTGAFTTVDIFDANKATPSAKFLAAYDAVLVYNNYDFSNATMFGDRLAAYHDQGGGVVIAAFTNTGSGLQGAYGAVANGYALMEYSLGKGICPGDELEDVLEPESPLITGVASLASGLACQWRSTAPIISNRTVVVMRWRGGGGEPIVMRGVRGNRTLVELNFYPDPKVWDRDGAVLLRNALKFSRCITCTPGTFSSAGEAI